ncbi:MAG: transposase [Planctomycetota bacterium]|nr:MAG: transposase [Planctomycetota bacterium]
MPDKDIQQHDVPPHARNLRAGRWSESLVCYAVTKCVENRRPVLRSDAVADIVVGCLDYLRNDGRIRLLAFCIMPDHAHVLFFLLGKHSLPDIMRSFGRFTARKINELRGEGGPFWQEGFHDHRCRDETDIEELLTYIEHNPVRACLVQQAHDWPYSSANPRWKSSLDREWYRSVC